MGSVQGRTVRNKPPSVNDDIVIRSQAETTILYIDIFFINGLPFLLSISKGFNLLVVTYLRNRKEETLYKGIKEHMAVYGKYNVKVVTIMIDGEGAIAPLKSTIELQGVGVEQCSKAEHVPTIERAIRQVKERTRSFINTLPFRLTIEMLIYLIEFLVSMINLFPKSTSVIDISPIKKLTNRDIDYDAYCKLEFGDYVQANEENSVTNSMKARTFPAICLGPVKNLQGSYYFMNLTTFSVVKRRAWVKMPLPNEIIVKINARASRDAQTLGDQIKFTFNDHDLNEDEEQMQDSEEPPIVENNEEHLTPPENEIDFDPHYFEEDDEVDFNPHYFEEENRDESNQDSVEPTHPYNLRKTAARQAYIEKYSMIAVSTYNVEKSIKQWGDEAKDSMKKEMKQLHDKDVFQPVSYESLTQDQKLRVLRTMMLVKRKRNGLLKSRFLADGSTQLRMFSAVDPSSPTVSTEALFMTAAIAASERRYKATVDIEGAYLHSKMVGTVYIKVVRAVADLLCEIDPSYEKFRLSDGSLVVKLNRALYGCIESARLFYNNISKTLTDFGFVKNLYDHCVFNKKMYNNQCTIVIHVCLS